MGKIIVTFDSVTYAMKAKRLLSKSGINSRLVKVGSEYKNGCAHGVEFHASNLLDAANIFRTVGLKYSVYNE